MPRPIVAVACALAFASCSSLSRFDQFMQPSPAILTINSAPPGAEARLSTGGACQTPCTLSVSAADDFTVTYALDGYVSRTIPVRFVPAVRSALIEVTAPSLDPNPVVVTLDPAPASPPPKAPPVKKRQRQQPPPVAPTAPLVPWPGLRN
jgi:PEGA domain